MSKYAIIGTLMQCFFLSILLADNSMAQRRSMDDIHLSLNVHGSVMDVFKAIEGETEFKFSLNHVKIDEHSIIDIHVKDKSLKEILEEISEKKNLKFKRINENIHVSMLERKDKASVEELIKEQNRTITGKVTSIEESEGVPGVNVLVKGTSTGTVTDIDGNYSIDVPSNDAILVYSSVGFVREEVRLEAEV